MATCDYYKVLEIPQSATENEIRKAYLKLARKHHPDKNKEDELKATEVFKMISKAYEILCDPGKKADYDLNYGKSTAGGNQKAGGSRGSSQDAKRGGRGDPFNFNSFYEEFAKNFRNDFGFDSERPGSSSEGSWRNAGRRGHREPSFTEVRMAQKHIPGLIGKNGWHMKEIEEQTGASIRRPNSWGNSYHDRRDDERICIIKIHGDKEARDKAKELIEYVKGRESQRTTTITIPRAYFNLLRHLKRTIRGESGCNYIKFGDEDVPHLDDSIPRPPLPNMGPTFEIKICGTPERIQMAIALIKDEIHDFKEQNKP